MKPEASRASRGMACTSETKESAHPLTACQIRYHSHFVGSSQQWTALNLDAGTYLEYHALSRLRQPIFVPPAAQKKETNETPPLVRTQSRLHHRLRPQYPLWPFPKPSRQHSSPSPNGLTADLRQLYCHSCPTPHQGCGCTRCAVGDGVSASAPLPRSLHRTCTHDFALHPPTYPRTEKPLRVG